MKKQLYYFGCIGIIGHHFFNSGGREISSKDIKIHGLSEDLLRCIDGTYPPSTDLTMGRYVEVVFRQLNVIIISWWDYSVDKRVKSNSNLIAYGYSSTEEVIADAKLKFPMVMNRQPDIKPFELN